MARKFFAGRPTRANTVNDAISHLDYKDTAPHSDLPSAPKRSNTFDGRSDRPDKNYYAIPSPIIEESHHQDGDNMIGVALGSPSAAWPHSSGGTVVATASATASATAGTDPYGNVDSNDPALKRKPSKWKKIGDLFRAKSAPTLHNDPQFYQVQVNGQPSNSSDRPAGSHLDSSHWAIPRQHTASRTGSHHGDFEQKRSKHRPHAKLVKEPSPPVAQKHWGGWSDEPEQGVNKSTPSPLLNVDIPDVEMERYSVMFGNLLGGQPSSSLLARRSKTLDMLKPHNEEDKPDRNAPGQRRATSPMPAKSPSFTLFPPTPNAKGHKSPGSPRFSRGPSPLQKTQSRSSPHLSSSTPSSSSRLAPSPEASTTNHARWDSEVSHLTATTSDGSATPVDDRQILAGVKPPPVIDQAEPTWEMVDSIPNPTKGRSPTRRQKKVKSDEPTAPSSKSSPQSQTQSPSTRKSDQERFKSPPPPDRMPPSIPVSDSKTSRTSPPQQQQQTFPLRSSSKQPPLRSPPSPPDSPSAFVDELTDDKPVEVSVARSISVTKRQKHALVPVNGATGESGGLRVGISRSASVLRTTSDENIVEKRVGTPTLESLQRAHEHHKSQNVVIESA